MRNVLIPQGSEQTAKEGRDREKKLENQRAKQPGNRTGAGLTTQLSCLGSLLDL